MESMMAISENESTTRSRFWDFVELTKPRISSMVLLTVGVAGYLAGAGQASLWSVMHAVIGTFLVAASGSAMNQYIERWLDARMRRTSGRPLPGRRLTSTEVVVFGSVMISCGMVYLLQTVGWLTAGLGLATWLLYVWIYTPLKTRTWINTIVGAVAGAMPILIGWVAAAGTINWQGWVLFSILFLWQFPHFMAIAWIYREQYAESGMKMLPVVDPTGRLAGIEAVATAILLLPISILPSIAMGDGGWIYGAMALILGLAYLVCSIQFLRNRNDQTSRRLLRVSLVYLPAVMLLLVVVPLCWS